jgi:hypothetical protein
MDLAQESEIENLDGTIWNLDFLIVSYRGSELVPLDDLLRLQCRASNCTPQA